MTDWNWVGNDDNSGEATFVIADKTYTFTFPDFKTAFDISNMLTAVEIDTREKLLKLVSSDIASTLSRISVYHQG